MRIGNVGGWPIGIDRGIAFVGGNLFVQIGGGARPVPHSDDNVATRVGPLFGTFSRASEPRGGTYGDNFWPTGGNLQSVMIHRQVSAMDVGTV